MNIIPILILSLTPGGEADGPLEVAQPVAEIGTARAGIPIVHTFRTTNRGSTLLTITDLGAVGCSCLQARASVRALLPGESSELRIEVNTLAQPAGGNVWKAAVRYRAEPVKMGAAAIEGEQLLQVKANLVREVEVEPAALSLVIDGGVTHQIKIADRRDKPLSVTRVRCASPHIRTEIHGPAMDKHGRRVQQITFNIVDACPPGRFADVLCLDTDDADYKELRIPVQVVKRAAAGVAVQPEQAALRLAKSQTSASMLLRIRDAQDRKVGVERIESDHPAIRSKWAAGPGEMATLRVGVELADGPREGKGIIKVHLREPEAQVIEIPVTWRGE
jgi:Protein of unknown function (DUF1573)